jgi:cation/acetate symporter
VLLSSFAPDVVNEPLFGHLTVRLALAMVAAHGQAVAQRRQAFAIAVSAILRALVHGLFWRRFTGQGALLGLWGGMACSVLLVVFSPVVSSTPDSI